MKRRTAMLLICSLLPALLSGCGNTNPIGPGASSDGVDYNQYLKAQGVYGCTDMGWYIYENNQIEFLDAGLKTPVLPLCAKADCPHKDPTTCSSYLPEGIFCIFAWNNLLYFEKFDTDSSSEDLYQMELDGRVSYAFSNGDKAFFHLSAQYSNEPVCWVDKEAVAKGKAEFQMLEFDD